MIHRVERQAETIRIQATDDVTVASVRVMVLNEQEKMVEKGEAIKGKGNWWEFVPGAEGKVIVDAWDLTGNKVKTELRSSK